MAAAYAALISLSQIIDQLLHPPPSHHFLVPTQQIELLQQLVADLIDFLEKFSNSNHETQHLESRIAGAAYEAEDVIESYVVKQIQANFETYESSARSFPSILKLIEYFVSIKEEADKIRTQKGVEDAAAACSSSSILVGSNNNNNKHMMIGFDEHLSQIRMRLAYEQSDLQITHVVGMGGVGKTTLATHLYKDAWVVDRFKCAWVSVSPEYNLGDIILALLQQINSNIKANGLDVDRLGVVLHKELTGRRYFVVLDDMWDIQVWNVLRLYLPNNRNGSRILVTTRILDLAKDMTSSEPYQLGLLNEENSLALMLGVFGKECFPNQLEDIGKSIARKCRGLPLALVVIGRLLAYMPEKKAYWEFIEQTVASTANDVNDEQCMRILRLSYSQLPVYLKPCFLYLAVFPKNVEIHASRLIRLWVAEGFIKPARGRTLEEVAEGYLEDLLNRNLVMVKTRGLIGKVKTCSIHDLIRDLCTKEVGTEKFHLCIPKFDSPSGSISSLIESERRLSIHTNTSITNEECNVLGSPTLNRSFFSYSRWVSRRRFARRLNLVRILDVVDFYSMQEILHQFNLRYITYSIYSTYWRPQVVSSRISLLWNLQTLVAPPALVSLPSEIWRMPQLRHLKMRGITLPHPPDKEESESIIVLQHLQTLSTVKDFIFREHVLKRIPNLKKLGIHYDASVKIEYSCLSNLASLKKLESLFLSFRGTWENFVLPSSLKKLSLSNCRIPWENMSVVGLLENLEVLKLQTHAAEGPVWNLKADEFCRLKFLLIDGCEMKTWAADDGGFPCLEHLHLVNMKMEDIPVEFAEIPTLQTINLNYCSRSLFASAKAISEEREPNGYEEVQIQSFPSEVPEFKKENVVGVEDEVQRFKGYLSEETEELDVIAIVDMPGIGKTTLAEKIFHDPEIVDQFPKRVWVHVSQDFTSKDILLAIMKAFTCIDEEIITKGYYELRNMVRGILSNEKFLVVVDDVRSREDWDQLRFAIPTWKNRGKVLITSRDKEIGWYINHHKDPHMRHFLDVEESFSHLQSVVFGNNQSECPPELEAECRLIAELCVGLPNIAVEVVGGILLEYSKAPSSVRKKAWEEVSGILTTFHPAVFLQQVISLSYKRLPYHLRKCFLYMGIFPEDYDIPAWRLIRMWIAEGFIQQNDEMMSLEEIAQNNLEDLVSRNLVRASKLNGIGKVKTCYIEYDEICDFCITEAGNVGEEITVSSDIGGSLSKDQLLKCHRLSFDSNNVVDFLSRNPCGPSVHTFTCYFSDEMFTDELSAIPAGFKQLRVLDVMPIVFTEIPSGMYRLLHIRYMVLSANISVLPSDFSKLEKIETVVIKTDSETLDIKADILNMIHLRHFKTNAIATLPEAKSSKSGSAGGGGEKIQTLGNISPWSCTKDAFRKARNVKRLSVHGNLAQWLMDEKSGSFDSLRTLGNLGKLKLINSKCRLHSLPPVDRFPPKLKILSLSGTYLPWSQMSIIGSLDKLEVLKLKYYAFSGEIWEANVGDFHHLEVLHIESTDLKIWKISQQQFPRLKHLRLIDCKDLLEVPIELADVPSFQKLDFYSCQRAAESVMKIQVKVKENNMMPGNVVRQFRVSIYPRE